MRDVTHSAFMFLLASLFQSTHPMRDVTDFFDNANIQYDISIHTSHAGCDQSDCIDRTPHNYFNPHIPCGMWQTHLETMAALLQFQSTHPMRDVTCGRYENIYSWPHFNPHIPCGMWHNPLRALAFRFNFNPHIPCGMWPNNLIFAFMLEDNFNPHIPCGMWLHIWLERWMAIQFQSTHPMRDVTQQKNWNCYGYIISIHTSHAGCDLIITNNINDETNFNPHIPCGMWLENSTSMAPARDFNPHIPCGMWRSTFRSIVSSVPFQSTHPMRDVTLSTYLQYSRHLYFNPHIPCGMWPHLRCYFN